MDNIQPQNIELEKTTLGSIMLEQDALDNVFALLTEDMFYLEIHKTIFKAIRTLIIENKPVDILTVTNQLEASKELENIGGAFYITELTSRIASTANLEFHVRILNQTYLQRALIKTDSETTEKAYDNGVEIFDLINDNISTLMDLLDEQTPDERRLFDISQENLDKIIKLREQKTLLTGISSGIKAVDEVLYGFQNSDLITLASRPGMGKSALVLQFAKNIAYEGIGVGIFSLEMPSWQLDNRLKANISGVNLSLVKLGQVFEDQLDKIKKSTDIIKKLPIYIDDRGTLNPIMIRSKALKWKKKYGIELLIVDYLQLITAIDKKGQNREGEISSITRALKALAKELDIPIIALSQLSRAVEARGDKKPMLSDLRESGAIEQDSDIVMFLYRPEYYKILEFDDGESTEGIAELDIAKHRNGNIKNVPLSFDGSLMKFEDINKE